MSSLKRRVYEQRRNQERKIGSAIQSVLIVAAVIGGLYLFGDDMCHDVGHALDVQYSFSQHYYDGCK